MHANFTFILGVFLFLQSYPSLRYRYAVSYAHLSFSSSRIMSVPQLSGTRFVLCM